MNRLSIKELEDLKSKELLKIKESENQIRYLNIKIQDQRFYSRFNKEFVNINKNYEISVYDFMQIIWKSLTKKYKKKIDNKYDFFKIFRFQENDFFKLGQYIFQVETSATVYNIETFIEEKPYLYYLANINRNQTKEDLNRFYNNLEKNLNKYINNHPELFI